VDAKPKVYVLSDSVGETAELVVKAAGSQFMNEDIEIIRIPFVKNSRDIYDILNEASGANCVIAYTLVLPELRDLLIAEADRLNIPVVDIMGPIMEAFSLITNREPKLEAGLVRRLDEEYFRKVEAIEFAVKYDDGKDPRGITKADLVILGVSRTSKTPLCMYLAHKRIKAANVPLVPEVAPPEEIFNLPPNKVIGLTIRPQQLNVIRQERLRTLGLTSHADYASMERILRELEYAEDIMRRVGCTVIDVTNKAVEENASKVLEFYYRNNRQRR
jgi:regulator of PEP synthase PpsR (kinase-PPPase family)